MRLGRGPNPGAHAGLDDGKPVDQTLQGVADGLEPILGTVIGFGLVRPELDKLLFERVDFDSRCAGILEHLAGDGPCGALCFSDRGGTGLPELD